MNERIEQRNEESIVNREEKTRANLNVLRKDAITRRTEARPKSKCIGAFDCDECKFYSYS